VDLIKLALAWFGLRTILKPHSPSPSPSPPPDAPRERSVAVADLYCGEPAGLGPPTDDYPGGRPLPPPPPSARAAGMDHTSWRARYPNGPPQPGTPAWPTVEGQQVPPHAEGLNAVSVRWRTWEGCIDWQANPVNAALRADLAAKLAFGDFNSLAEELTYGRLDAWAVDALYTLGHHAPVAPVEAPWRGCPQGSVAIWDVAEDLARLRRTATGYVHPSTPAIGSGPARQLRNLLRRVRVGAIHPTCSQQPLAELRPARGSRLSGVR